MALFSHFGTLFSEKILSRRHLRRGSYVEFSGSPIVFNRLDNKSTLKGILILFYKLQINFHPRFPVRKKKDRP